MALGFGRHGWFRESGRSGQITNRKYLNKVFNEKGAKKIDDAMTRAFGVPREIEGLKLGTFGWFMGIGIGMNFRLRQGEKFLPALAKEALEDVKYGLFPELLAIQGGRALAEAYPAMNAMAEQRRANILNYNTYGGGYTDTEANYAARARALETIKRHHMAAIGGEARKFHR